MVRLHYWASAQMIVTAIGLAGTVFLPLTSIDMLAERHNTVQQSQHRGSGRLTQLLSETPDSSLARALSAQSHRGSGRLVASEIEPTSVMAWRGSGRISEEDTTGIV